MPKAIIDIRQGLRLDGVQYQGNKVLQFTAGGGIEQMDNSVTPARSITLASDADEATALFRAMRIMQKIAGN